jgi:dual specificity phosphatase 12
MSYLLHGSTAHTGMGWLDLVPLPSPNQNNLYIGGLYALFQTHLIEEAGITHVLSVLDYDPLLRETFGHLKHLYIRAEDHPNENLLQYFDEAVTYIDQALNGTHQASPGEPLQPASPSNSKGGAVFVHCAMGKSRSATLVCAYLIHRYQLTPAEALEQLCEGRPVSAPNPGFAEQLGMWADMCAVDRKYKQKSKEEKETEKRSIYNHWAAHRFTGEVWEWEHRSQGKKDENKLYSKL